jgi:hypothetical protein
VNYFAHGIRFLDHPWFLAGTALPDWLSVVDRRIRLRAKRVTPWAQDTGDDVGALACGVLQHLEDDGWFHKSRAFAEATGWLTRTLREFLGPGDGFRCGFLAHIACELLLDAILIERHPEQLDRYYDVLGKLDGRRLSEIVSKLAGQAVDLDRWLPLFCREQFLRDYTDSSRLAYRLNQVLRRIKLDPLPGGIAEVLSAGRDFVRTQADRLLPAPHFAIPGCTPPTPAIEGSP